MQPSRVLTLAAALFSAAPVMAQTAANPQVLGAVDAATSPDEVRAAISAVDTPEGLEAVLDSATKLDHAGPIIERLETEARSRVLSGSYRSCDVFFPETGPLFPAAADDSIYLTMTVAELIGGGDGMLKTSSEFDHDVISMVAVTDGGLSEAIHMYASQNIHRIDGQLRVHGAKILSDTDKYHRATFLILKDVGLVYLRGDGQIVSAEGAVTELAGRTCD